MLTVQFVVSGYFYLLVSFLAIYLCGHIVTILFNRQPGVSSLFLKMTIGLLLMPTCYAIFKTGGKTVLLFNAVLAMGFVGMYYRDISWRIPKLAGKIFNFNKEILPLLLFMTLVYFLNLYTLFDFSDGGYRLMHPDYAYYARLAGYLRDTGVENIYIEYYLDPLKVNTLYHYMEVWSTALVSETYGLHVQYSLHLIVYSLIYSCVYTGFINLIQSLREGNSRKRGGAIWILPALFFLVSMFGFLYPNHIKALETNIWTLSVFSIPKLNSIYLFLVWIILLIRKQNYFAASLVCSLAAINYTMVTPGLFLAFGALLIYRVLFKLDTFKSMLLNFLPIVTTAVFLLIFYIGKADEVSNVIMVEKDASLFSILKIKTSVNIFLKTLFQIVITSAPYLMILYFLRREMFTREKDVTIFWVFLTVFSIIAWILFNVAVDAVQLWSNLYVPIANIFGCYLLIVLYNKEVKNRYLKHAVILTMLLTNVVYNNPFSNPNEKLAPAAIAGLPENASPRFAYVKEPEDYEALYQNNELIYAGQIYSLIRKYDPLYITCISNDVVQSNELQMIKINSNSTFPRFLNDTTRTTPFASVQEGQKQFIIEHRIDYLLVNKQRKLPEQFSTLFDPVSKGTIDGYSVYMRLKGNPVF